jgi:plastocyanin
LIARAATAALLAAGLAVVVAVPADAGKKKPVHKTVRVGDYFLAPSKLTVPVRSTITWKWPSSVNSGDSHDVKLTKTRPKGVKPFQSQIASGDYKFKRKLKVKGKYVVICSLHPNSMRMTITVT